MSTVRVGVLLEMNCLEQIYHNYIETIQNGKQLLKISEKKKNPITKPKEKSIQSIRPIQMFSF